MKRLSRSLLLLMTLCFLPSCELSLGPKVKESVVIQRVGQPSRVVQNITVKTSVNGTITKQDIGGWYAIPPDHFDALMRAIPDKDKPK